MSKHISEIQIRFNDVDIAGHVNNAIYQYYYDFGKLRYFDDVFGNLIKWSISGFVLLKISVEYINPIYLHDKIVVETSVAELKNKSLIVKQVIREKDTEGEKGIKSVSESVMVAYHYVNKETFVIPDEWRKCVIEFENL